MQRLFVSTSLRVSIIDLDVSLSTRVTVGNQYPCLSLCVKLDNNVVGYMFRLDSINQHPKPSFVSNLLASRLGLALKLPLEL